MILIKKKKILNRTIMGLIGWIFLTIMGIGLIFLRYLNPAFNKTDPILVFLIGFGTGILWFIISLFGLNSSPSDYF